MKFDQPAAVRLCDYQPFPFTITETRLDFVLDEAATLVRSHLKICRNKNMSGPLVLDGENMELLSIQVDGTEIAPSAFEKDEHQLILADLPDQCILQIETRFSPTDNHALSGLYMSGGRFCTQCEAQGFRNITYFPDRPDVMSKFTVRIEAETTYPSLLSNGNLLDSGSLPNGRHFALWEDPFKKPAYLFALVAGQFDLIEDQFTTMSDKVVPLRIYVDPGDAHLADYAMDSLKRAMKWDEEVFGREYDLDLFMIVAVRSFNFGAMENKGLNIFNSSVLLADAKTATDANFEVIESVVAHEYFHNWTGNRITCRDWFQLCLKEGLTVFRDQEFSADQRGHAICRIKDVKALRARQFPEDAGPLAHPVRPSSYLAIDNFYTATVYEKGAELIRALKTILGDADFAKGMDRYFETCDGTAATMEQFLDCFASVSGQDLSNFLIWYGQAGTPKVDLTQNWDQKTGKLTLDLRQSTDPTPGQPEKQAVPIPVRIGLLDDAGPLSFTDPVNGEKTNETVLLLEKFSQSWTFEGLSEQPLISAFRRFSAPVNFTIKRTSAEQARLIASDPDLFTRWEEAQSLGREQLLAMTQHVLTGKSPTAEPHYLSALANVIEDQALEPAFVALVMQPPSEDEIFLLMPDARPEAIRTARQALIRQIAMLAQDRLLDLHQNNRPQGKFQPDAKSAGLRAAANQALLTLTQLRSMQSDDLAWSAWTAADNMTDTMAALAALAHGKSDQFRAALVDFYAKWQHNPLVMDKWFSLQAMSGPADQIEPLQTLLDHADFDVDNPNRARSVYGVFPVGNLPLFHLENGAGYKLLADGILQIDPQNPALAARLMGAFSAWRHVEPVRRQLAREQIERVLEASGLSKNTFEIASRHLAD
ncbi:MAG: aminopeptidase N [Robiginitomaculum sp.]|nr:MAG: aminopeptidase N [Robiginitomaculum sp.]